MSEDIRSYTIPANKKLDVEKQIIKLNKRAVKLGMNQVSISFGTEFVEEREVLQSNPDYPEDPPTHIKKKVILLPVEISGIEKVGYEGYTFVACLQHLPTGENILRSIRDDIQIPHEYRNIGPECNHCNVNRYRKDTYLVVHDDTSQFIQVGSSCIKDFLGGHSPDNILAKAEFLSELNSFMSGYESGGYGGAEVAFGMEEFLAHTSAMIAKFGWLSKTKAQEYGGFPTSSQVQWNIGAVRAPKDWVRISISDRDIERAKSAIEWCENISDAEVDKSDYLYNIRTICRSGFVSSRLFGYAASIMSGYDRFLGEQVAKEKSKLSEWVGSVKERTLFKVTILNEFVYDTPYGTSHKYIMSDSDGNIFAWNASSKQDLEIGIEYAIKGTVKAHSEYKGRKQTDLTRCQVVSRL